MPHDAHANPFGSIDCIGVVPSVSEETRSPSPSVPVQFDRDPEPNQWSKAGQRAHFESAETDRLNQAHWSVVDDSPINDILAYRLPTMRARSNHEAWNNPTLKGLILSHTVAVVGDEGPQIDLQADDEEGDRWCDEAEQVWEEWCRDCDAAGRVSLATRIKRWNRHCWVDGEWIDQLVFPDTAGNGVQLRLHEIEPARLASPMDSIGDTSVVLGIDRDAYRRPTRYHIAADALGWRDGSWIDAANIIHGWDEAMAEAGQARGVPWAQVGLPVAADLRDYDVQVLDAARGAADMALYAYAEHPDAEFVADVPTSIAIRRRRINNLAPGWKIGAVPATHPTAQYKEHRQERQGDLGRGEGVPSMVTRLDARDHNYSSARFDYGLMHESAKHVRASLYNLKLFFLASLVLGEAQLSGLLRPAPSRVWTDFVWPAMPQIDDEKASNAEEKYLKIGTISYTDAVMTRHGRRARDLIRRRARDMRMLQAYGLPSVAEATGRGTTSSAPSSGGN